MSDPLRAAMVRFSTLDPSLWGRALRALASLGFNAVDAPLVWREHETAAGRFDFDAPERSIARFVDAAAAAGLRVIVRLGPWPTSDLAALGLPERVLLDRACQARTRRQNPVYVLDPPRLAPLPSLASAAYRREARAWVSAAAAAIAPRVADGAIARVIVGHGPPAVLRDDPFEADHHPDARGDAPALSPPHHGPLDAGVAEVLRQSAQAAEFLDGLVDAAADAGVARDAVALAVTGSVLLSPLALSRAATHALSFTAPPTRAGVTGIWRQVRLAASFARRPHVDLRAGAPPFEPPTRATHTLAAARVALAAGARDFTVQMGCAGDGWVGALLDERAEPRPHAARWAPLLAWAASLPDGRDAGAELAVRPDDAARARAATGVHPLPLGLLAWVGFTPDELTAKGAPDAGADDLERAMTALALPHRRAVDAGDGDAWRGGDAEAFVARARARWASLTPTLEPEGAALVRAVEHEGGATLVVASSSEGAVRVTPPEGAPWRDDAGPVREARTLRSGEVLVMHRARGAGDAP